MDKIDIDQLTKRIKTERILELLRHARGLTADLELYDHLGVTLLHHDLMRDICSSVRSVEELQKINI